MTWTKNEHHIKKLNPIVFLFPGHHSFFPRHAEKKLCRFYDFLRYIQNPHGLRGKVPELGVPVRWNSLAVGRVAVLLSVQSVAQSAES